MGKGLRKARFKTAIRGLTTVMGLRERGFFVPYKHAASVPRNPPTYRAFEAVFAERRSAMDELLDAILKDGAALMEAATGRLAGHWDGGYFGPLDAASAWAVIRKMRPRRIIEVGSGSSTHVMCAAVADFEQRPEIICVDPAPRSEISSLGVTWEASVLSDAHLALFETLHSGDIAFFDSSHVLFQGTDVDVIYNRILPSLKPGVAVHFHDVFLPDPYPENWDYRAYSEQLALGGWLLSGACETIFSCRYAETRMAERVADAMSGLPDGPNSGTSLWFRR